MSDTPEMTVYEAHDRMREEMFRAFQESLKLPNALNPLLTKRTAANGETFNVETNPVPPRMPRPYESQIGLGD